MKTSLVGIRLAVTAIVLMLCMGTLVSAQTDYTKGIYFKQNIGGQVPLDTLLRDENGRPIHLGDVFAGRPVILVPIAFRCQAACAMVADGLLKTLTAMTNVPRARLGPSHFGVVGQDFDVVFVSIDPLDDDPVAVKNGTPTPITEMGETPLPNNGQVALTKKNLIIKAYDQRGTEHGWHLLTGTFDNIHRIAQAIGLGYYFNASTDVIRNPTGIVFLTPTGKISSYILGSDYPTSVLTDDVKTASEGRLGSPTENIMFVCFTPDPSAAKRSKLIEGILFWACAATVLGVLSMIVILSLPDWRKSRGGPTHPAHPI